MTAEMILKVRGSPTAGGGLTVCRLAITDRELSLAIPNGFDGGVLVSCDVGSHQESVIAALSSYVLLEGSLFYQFSHLALGVAFEQRLDSGVDRCSETALFISHFAWVMHGALVEARFVSYILRIPVPPVLSFHKDLKHRPRSVSRAMIAQRTHNTDHTPPVVHRAQFTRNGGDTAPVDQQKGALASCRRGAERLRAAADA